MNTKSEGGVDMRAMVYHGPKDLRIENIEMVSYNDDEVLIKVKSTSICGSDVHGYLGTTGRRIPPLVMGHEFTGVIEKIGTKVKGFSKGDRVAVFPEIFCEECEWCKRGLVNLCPNRKIFGVLTFNGSFADYIAVPVRNLFKLPDNETFEQGSLGEPLSVAVHAVNNGGDLKGKNVLILGAGAIGLFILEVVKTKKPDKIFITDLSDSRLAVAKKLGADYAINTSKSNDTTILDSVGKRGVDVAIEAVGVTETVQYGLSHLKQQGKCVFVGVWKKYVEVDMHEIVNNELSIVGSTVYTLEDFETAIKMLESGEINTDLLITKVATLEDGPKIFEELAENFGDNIKVILNN